MKTSTKPRKSASKRKRLDPELIPGYVLQNTLAIDALREGMRALSSILATYVTWVYQSASRPLSTENTQALLNQIDEMRKKL